LVRSCSACPVGQPIDQWHRTTVPLVLNGPSSQILNISSRYHTNCLTTFLTQLTNPFNG